MTRFARQWWPIPAMPAPIIAAQIIWFGHYHASGHAAGHLASATMIFGVVFALAVLVWAYSRCFGDVPNCGFWPPRSRCRR